MLLWGELECLWEVSGQIIEGWGIEVVGGWWEGSYLRVNPLNTHCEYNQELNIHESPQIHL